MTSPTDPTRSTLRRPLLLAALAFAGAAFVLLQLRDGAGAPMPEPAAKFVGRAACAQCHAAESAAFADSHHDLAMQPATPETVLGNFDGASFAHYDVTSTFFREGDKFVVRTDGPDGVLRDYPVKFVFGVTPLQQYLIDIGNGRLQSLTIAWDARSREDGGQRWYHLYPNERIPAGDELHWTGLQQNWNYMCAECHSTDLQKGYDAEQDRYTTTWHELDVSCEACHGPGSAHVAWAEGNADFARLGTQPGKGLVVSFDERRDVTWGRDLATGNPVRSRPRTSQKELDTCARCHSRRTTFAEDVTPGAPLLDTHLPALLTEGLYHANGLMQDEVYNYQSFLQSRMNAHGVTCSDCHEPHSGKLRAPGNAVCTQCHDPRYEREEHHRHQPNGPGAQCTACHMPTVDYMGVDPRHDHSFQIPRPDLTTTTGAPNACNRCHQDRDAAWATAAIQGWHGRLRTDRYPWAEAFAAARRNAPDASTRLQALLVDPSQPAVVRATALHELPGPLAGTALQVAMQSLADGDPMVRWAAVERLAQEPPAVRESLRGSLNDAVRAVRMSAARALVGVHLPNGEPAEGAAMARGLAEYEAAQRTNADRPEGRLNVGNLALDRGDYATAAAQLRAALALLPTFVPARVNLADLLRSQGDEQGCEATLRAGLALTPNNASLQHVLGLSLVRQGRLPDAIAALGAAMRAEPDSARYTYVYAVALETGGRLTEAIEALQFAHDRRADSAELVALLAEYRLQAGDEVGARAAATELLRRWPDAPQAAALRERLLR